MSRPTKFIPGPAIRSLSAVVALIEQGEWLYWHDKPKSPAVLINMNVASLRGAARFGRIRLALPNPERKPCPNIASA